MNSFFFSLLMVPPQTADQTTQNPILGFLPLIFIIGIFYFLIIRPQNKKQKETKKMIDALKKGDKIITIGGLHGVIQTVREGTVIIKVDENTKLEFLRSAISSVVSQAKEEKEEKKPEELEADNTEKKKE